jgi:putative endonuclease
MRETSQPSVYLMANRPYGVIYCGVTSDLFNRVIQHREGQLGGFSHEHATHRLVWFEQHATMETAILREKRIKRWNRQWKINLIEAENPDWRDLAVNMGLAMLPPRPVKIERAGVGSPPSRG